MLIWVRKSLERTQTAQKSQESAALIEILLLLAHEIRRLISTSSATWWKTNARHTVIFEPKCKALAVSQRAICWRATILKNVPGHCAKSLVSP
jgi:hypothetical protein